MCLGPVSPLYILSLTQGEGKHQFCLFEGEDKCDTWLTSEPLGAHVSQWPAFMNTLIVLLFQASDFYVYINTHTVYVTSGISSTGDWF